jgi:RNA polymerase sigma-70 factor (ECF subfamily)
VDDPVLHTELRGVLGAAVDALPREYRTAFLLHDVEGMPNREIARSLGISLPAVKSRVHRSRLFLRRRLAQYLAVA